MSIDPVKLNIQQKNTPNLVTLNIEKPNQTIKLNITNTIHSPNLVTLNIAKPNQTIITNSQEEVDHITKPTQTETYRITANEYQRYSSTREHIYNITDTYIGSDEKMTRSERVLNMETMTFNEEEITLPEGVENIFVEISSNAGDNVARSLRHGIDPGEVTIKMDSTMISVRNGGISITIEIHEKEKIRAPELIFGVINSSSNYDKTKIRTECGRNGYGAKLTNIFSEQFMITIGDPHNKKWYRQIWNKNMTIRSEPEIKNYDGESFVEVVYKMDFKRFGYECYPDEAFKLFSRHAADMSFTGKVPVSFNGIKLNVQNSINYAKLYLGNEIVTKSIVFYQWAPGVKTVDKKGVLYAKYKGVVPMVEICAVDTPDNAINVSFVNGKWTRNGGVHAEAAFKAIASGLLNTINGNNQKQKKSKKRSLKLNLGDIKRHVSMFVSCWIGDPKFDGQPKHALRSPTPKISINNKILQPIMKWDLINRLYAELEAKHYKASSKSDGKKKVYLSDLKGEDANLAGKAESLDCTLYITEGKSAMGFGVKMISLFDKGRDYIGLLPLKGKPLNVMNADNDQIWNNEEIADIKKMTGIKERVNYLLDENFNTLRYGHFMVLADSDNDGKHILGLILNLFYCRYPSLLARGYVKYLRTKIVDVRKGNQMLKFYTNHQYEVWQKNTPNYKTWEHSYFKGLGSSEDSDIEDEFKSPRIVQCFYDDLSPMTFQLAFHKKLADQRKDWIRNWQPDFTVEEMDIQPISSFINHEFIQFSIADVARSIPRFMDGLKLGQRKIIWGSMKKWKATVGTSKAKKIKVGNLSSYVSSETGYHHGEKCLSDTIVKMVHDFVGTNNLPYFCPNGQFGCVDPKTPILLWNGKTELAENINIGTILVGDDGKKRTVSNIVSGIDDMYEITQTYGDTYIVNSIHILTLIIPSHKKIILKPWSEVMYYYNRSSKRVEVISESHEYLYETQKTIPDDNIIDIPLNEYLNLSQYQKNFLYGFKKNSKYLSKITVRKIYKGKYCGWNIDGNERFLLADSTVTHNTRNMLGKDASQPRYTHTKPKWWWRLVFKKEDQHILKIIIDEGEDCEPVTLLPIIPLHLINGTNGIGTGHSTFIPNHNPLDICAWITAKLNNYQLPSVIPWYRDFIGNISINEKGYKNKLKNKDDPTLIITDTNDYIDDDTDDEDVLGGDTVEINKYTKYTMVTTGKFDVTGNKRKKITVTELPIGRSMHDYDIWLGTQREAKNISGFKNYSKAHTVLFEINGMKNPTMKKLRLIRSYGMSNMVLLDMNNRPIKYGSTIEIMESFYALRLPYYQLRKDNILQNTKDKIEILNNKIKFIIAVINGYNLIKENSKTTIEEAVNKGFILSMGLSKKNIIPQMKQLGFPLDLLKQVTLYQCTQEELELARKELDNMKQNMIEKNKITPQQMWQNDLDLFVAAYCKEYKCKHTTQNVTLNTTPN